MLSTGYIIFLNLFFANTSSLFVTAASPSGSSSRSTSANPSLLCLLHRSLFLMQHIFEMFSRPIQYGLHIANRITLIFTEYFSRGESVSIFFNFLIMFLQIITPPVLPSPPSVISDTVSPFYVKCLFLFFFPYTLL